MACRPVFLCLLVLTSAICDMRVGILSPMCGGPKCRKGPPRIAAAVLALQDINDGCASCAAPLQIYATLNMHGHKLEPVIYDSANEVSASKEVAMEAVTQMAYPELQVAQDGLGPGPGPGGPGKGRNLQPDAVRAVLGASSSKISAAVAVFLSALHIPQVSFASIFPALSDKSVYPYFTRTVPRLAPQEAYADMVSYFDWKVP